VCSIYIYGLRSPTIIAQWHHLQLRCNPQWTRTTSPNYTT